MSLWPRLWPRTIRRQLIVGVAGIHLVLMTLFVGDLVVRQRRLLLAESVEQTGTLARTLAVGSASWVLANDVAGLQEVVRAVQADPDFRYVIHGRCTFSNPAALSLLGFSRPEELLGADVHDLIHHHRADGTAWPAEGYRVRRLLASGETVRADDEVFWRPDGTSFPVSALGSGLEFLI